MTRHYPDASEATAIISAAVAAGISSSALLEAANLAPSNVTNNCWRGKRTTVNTIERLNRALAELTAKPAQEPTTIILSRAIAAAGGNTDLVIDLAILINKYS
jgi:hypothetical protein